MFVNVSYNRATKYTSTCIGNLRVTVELNADFVACFNLDCAKIGENNFRVS